MTVRWTPRSGLRATPGSRPSRGTTEASSRDVALDNAKGLLIFLVVVGHAISTVHAPGSQALGAWIYFFHMPAFVFVSGLMSKRYIAIDDGRVSAMIRGLVLPYVVFQLVLLLLDMVQNPRVDLSVTQMLTPAWPLWFLPALFFWRMATPFLSRIRFPLVWALAATLLVPLTPAVDWTLGINRAVSFLPFFVLGLLMDGSALQYLRRGSVRIAALVALLIAFPLAGMFRERLTFRWLFWSDTYEMLKVSAVEGISTKFLVMLIALLMSAAFFALVPTGRTFLTDWGRYSMYPMLLHGVLVRLFRIAGWGDVFDDSYGLPIFVLVCALLTAVMASGPVRSLSRPLVQPSAQWLERKAASRTPAPL